MSLIDTLDFSVAGTTATTTRGITVNCYLSKTNCKYLDKPFDVDIPMNHATKSNRYLLRVEGPNTHDISGLKFEIPAGFTFSAAAVLPYEGRFQSSAVFNTALRAALVHEILSKLADKNLRHGRKLLAAADDTMQQMLTEEGNIPQPTIDDIVVKANGKTSKVTKFRHFKDWAGTLPVVGPALPG
ncbi:hypothetical protein J8273_8518 [Carpediemonas membranifera]|uniref:Uncharacterized protein n=1 Tax=Carpediemonas membranifera TaxID=201153 RepID=A0A8J6AXR3_9EUKA|nr:hypothetical protein J8273_8518 [Carpediemonas membranifera]|eukprot:KAG9389839.1 hypothetical protein J8273_8518 [Carpediemonas membranifera]